MSLECWKQVLNAGIAQAQVKLNSQQLKVFSHLTVCRTALAGSEVYACTHCGYQLKVHRSCRDRHCPGCQHRATQKWCELRRADVLPVTYYHMVFTLPHTLNGWVSCYAAEIYRCLFESVWHSLNSFGQSPRRLNGQLGVMAVLHTWGQTLSRHVHLHCLVPGGALTEDGQWHAATSPYLFPVKALSRHYRGRMVSLLRQGRTAGLLELIDDDSFDEKLAELMSTKWNVYAKVASYGHDKLIDYLGRYTRKIALTPNRLQSFNGEQVGLKYRDYRDNRQKVMQLTPSELVRRFALHVLPKGFMRVRYYGYLANAVRRKKLKAIRAALSVEPALLEKTEECNELFVLACPQCGENHWHFIGMSRRLHWEPG